MPVVNTTARGGSVTYSYSPFLGSMAVDAPLQSQKGPGAEEIIHHHI